MAASPALSAKEQLVAQACDISIQSSIEAAHQASCDGNDSYLDHVLEYLPENFHENSTRFTNKRIQ